MGIPAETTAGSTTANDRGATQRATYLKHLLTQASAAADESGLGLKELRDRAIALVNERSFPHGRDEEWRFTDLSDMLSVPFQRAAVDDTAAGAEGERQARQALNNFALVEGGYRLVTYNGHYAAELSVEGRADGAPKLPEGAVVAPLSAFEQSP